MDSEKLVKINGSFIAAVIVLLISFSAALGWFIGAEFLNSIFTDSTMMKFNAAVSFFFSGLAVLLTSQKKKKYQSLSIILTSFALLIGLVTLLEYVLITDFQIDNFFISSIHSFYDQFPGRMAVSSAILLVVVNASLLLTIFDKLTKLAYLVLPMVCLYALIVIMGQLYHEQSFYSFKANKMALNTALSFFSLSAGILFLKPKGIIKTAQQNLAGGIVLKKLFPLIILLPPVLGWISLHGQKLNLFSFEMGFTLSITAYIVILLIIVWWVSVRLNETELNKINEEKKHREDNELFEFEKAKYRKNLELLNEELESNVKERTLQLENSNKELESFAYSVSHDLRAPLRSINGFSQALMEDYYDTLDDIAKDFLQRINNSSHKMGCLIDDLLNLSRITRRELIILPVDLSRIVEEITLSLKSSLKGNNIVCNITPGIEIMADGALIKIALENLINNAIKFSSHNPEPVIEFGALVFNNKTTFYIKDNGVGFDMKYYNKLFGPFQRLHSEKEFEGTGIGLATVKRIISKHGGEIWAEGELNKGSIFYFTLS